MLCQASGPEDILDVGRGCFGVGEGHSLSSGKSSGAGSHHILIPSMGLQAKYPVCSPDKQAGALHTVREQASQMAIFQVTCSLLPILKPRNKEAFKKSQGDPELKTDPLVASCTH